MTCFAIDACLLEANGISTVLYFNPFKNKEGSKIERGLHGMPIGAVHGSQEHEEQRGIII
jgi:hypothetical protein